MNTLAEDIQDEFERLYREIGPVLWRSIYIYAGGSSEIADEAVAEAFARALANRTPIRSPRGWLYTTAFRLAARELRDRKNRVDALPDSPVEMSDLTVVMDAMRKLNPSERAAIYLHHVAGFSSQEISELIRSSQIAVRVRLHRARRRLRRALEDEEG